jgi:hypothetical protein
MWDRPAGRLGRRDALRGPSGPARRGSRSALHSRASRGRRGSAACLSLDGRRGRGRYCPRHPRGLEPSEGTSRREGDRGTRERQGPVHAGLVLSPHEVERRGPRRPVPRNRPREHGDPGTGPGYGGVQRRPHPPSRGRTSARPYWCRSRDGTRASSRSSSSPPLSSRESSGPT